MTKILLFFLLICVTEELRAKRKKQLKKDTASKIKSLVEEVCVKTTGMIHTPGCNLHHSGVYNLEF